MSPCNAATEWPCADNLSASEVRIAFGGGEHQCLIHVHVGQQVAEHPVLVRHVIGEHHALLDVLVFVFCCRNGNALRCLEQTRGQIADYAIQRRREQQGLACLGRSLGDAFHIIDEAHVQHAVRFVEDQHFQAREIDAAAFQVVDQTARRGDQNIHMAGQHTVLHRVRHAAQDADDLEAHVLAVLGRGIAYLLRQFAGRGQHQHARAFAGQCGRRGQTVQRGQDERGGLAAAGLR